MTEEKDAHDHLVSAAGKAIAQGMTKEQFLKAAAQLWDIRAEMAGK